MKQIVIALCTMLLSLPVLAQEQLFGGVGNGSPSNPGALVLIDQTTGVATVLADPVTPGGLSGLTFLPDGRLLGTTIGGFGSTSTLVQLDPATGALLATIGSITDGATGPAISISDLTTQPGTGVVFAIRANADGASLGGYLYTIDPNTAVATFVGNTGTGVGLGLAFTPNGMLFKTSGTDLLTLNPTDASVLATTPLSVTIGIDGLAARPSDGILFGTRSFTGDTEEVYTIDPSTGTMTLVGTTGAGHPSDLAFQPAVVAVPTLDAAGLLGLMMLLAVAAFIAATKRAV